MSSITLANARNLQVNQVLARRIWDTLPQIFDLAAHLPWLAVDGEARVVNRASKVKTNPTGVQTQGRGVIFADPAANPGTDFTSGDNTEAKAAYDPSAVNYYVRELVGDVDMSLFTERVLSGQNPQREFQLDAKLTAFLYAFASEFITANGTAAADIRFTGLDTMIAGLDSSQTISPPGSGSRVKTRALDELLSLIYDGDGQPNFLLMSPAGLLSVKDAVRATGTVLNVVPDAITGKPRLAYDNVPIYLNSFIATANSLTTIYAGILGEDVGLYAIYPDGVGDRGLIQEPQNQAPTADYSVSRVHWYCGLATHGGRSLARLQQFSTATGG